MENLKTSWVSTSHAAKSSQNPTQKLLHQSVGVFTFPWGVVMSVWLLYLAIFTVGLTALAKWLSSPALKGLLGEKAVNNTLSKSLQSPDYVLLRDVTLPTKHGTTQIDHIVLSRFGVFVVETKNMSGWIFGSEKDHQWTQSFRRSRVLFQNPLHQNYAHVSALQELLGLDTSKFHSTVVFTGSAVFKKQMPLNVLPLGGLVPYIQARTIPLLRPDEVERSIQLIESTRLKAGAGTNALHINSLRAGHRSIGGVVNDARLFLQHGTQFLVAVKIAIGIIATVMLLTGGNILLRSLSGLAELGAAKPVATVSNPSLPAAQPASPPSAVNRRFPVNPQAMPHSLEQQRVARARQKDAVRDEVRNASLLCGYSTDTMRCACYEPKGEKVVTEFDECRALADGQAR